MNDVIIVWNNLDAYDGWWEELLVGMESLSGGIENYIREHALFT